MLRIRNISANEIISISAIIIALASVSIAIWEGVETRKHNRLSVRPKFEIHFISSKDNYGYELVNSGLGPAIITGIRIFVDNEEIHGKGFSGYDELLEKLGLQNKLIAHDAVAAGITVRAGDKKKIIVFGFSEDDDPATILPEVYQRVRIEIGYNSMYDESFVCKIPK